MTPDPQRHAAYRQHYAAYKELYPALKPGFHATAVRAADAAAAAAQQQEEAQALAQYRRAPPAELHSIVSPSILSADFSNLAHDVKRVVEAGEGGGGVKKGDDKRERT